MHVNAAWNMFIFREGAVGCPGEQLKAGLRNALSSARNIETVVTALLRAGEFECALTDCGSCHSAAAESITDALAAALISDGPGFPAQRWLQVLDPIVPPENARVAPAEGFSYYALHPLQFAELAADLSEAPEVAVLGIRSIGTTLSAVVKAALQRRGCQAERITVRPEGHPYDRKSRFSPQQLAWVREKLAVNAEFVVVDEGPGMSGSSFLSVGEAIAQAGVPAENITFLCSRHADPAALVAPDAAARWPRFRSRVVANNRFVPNDTGEYLGGGNWRRHFLSNTDWPASWTQMERLKYLSRDGRFWLSFEGLGRVGEEVHARARCLAHSGLCPTPETPQLGFGRYPVVSGSCITGEKASLQMLESIAAYCAYRHGDLARADRKATDLNTPLRHNVKEEFGLELDGAELLQPPARTVITDNRMMPHNWRRDGSRLLKMNAAVHGDDHFFPGPTDIAWDLAGAIVEWGLTRDATTHLLDLYRKATGDDPSGRMPGYLLAYSMFRTAYCRMAAAAVGDESEARRLTSAHARYRSITERALRKFLEHAQPQKISAFESLSRERRGPFLRGPALQTT